MSYTQNFDGSGSVPAGWTWSPAFSVTSTPGGGISPVSATNVLELAATLDSVPRYGTYGTQDSNGGNTSASCWFNAEGTTHNQYFESIVRGNNSDLSVAGKCYKARLETDAGQVQLIRLVSGSPTTLGSVIVGGGIPVPEWYNTKVEATGSSTTTVIVTVQRRSDSKYLTTSGTWQATPTAAITYSDTSGTVTGSGYAGIAIVSKSDNAYADDFAFSDVTPSALGTIGAAEGHDTPSFSVHVAESAAIARTEGHDTAAISGTSPVGTIAKTEGHDTAALFAGGSQGSMAKAEGRDAPVLIGHVPNAIFTAQEGRDLLSSAGVVTSVGTFTPHEAADVPLLIGVERQGILAAIERHDTPSISGHFAIPGTSAATEGRDTPSFSGLTTYAALAIAEARDKAAIFGIAAGIPPYFKVQEQRDIAVLVGGLPTVRYHVYMSDAAGQPIDYATPVATVDGTSWTSTSMATPGTWGLAVRAFSICGEEQNLDCSVFITFDAAGNDISNMPAPPSGLRTFATRGGGIRVEWAYPPTRGTKVPTGFHVYVGTGGTPNYAAPAATVLYSTAIMSIFTADLTGLVDGQKYSVGVRAFNGISEEANTTTASVTADATGPLPVQGLTATLT